MEKRDLCGMTIEELDELAAAAGLSHYAASQISDWLYKKRVSSIDEMTNLSKSTREILSETCTVGHRDYISCQISTDGTKKYLFPVSSGMFVEAAYIPDRERATLCVSSQVGCKMGCLFCMTGKQGFQGNLTAADIINQIIALPEFETLTNIVYMGMGEPLDNLDEVMKSLAVLTSDWGFGWSPRRITVSTIGLVPAMERFMNESNAHLAVSMHTPFDEERKRLMPVQTAYPILQVIESLRTFDFGLQRRISFEYIMLAGVNDSIRHADEIVGLVAGLKCRVNLIRFHPIPDTPLTGSAEPVMVIFRDRLNARGVTCTIRASRGEDIFAACGLLSTSELVKKQGTDF
ncbi:MAG: 23S rRNA (adenine(2503)-C(2))-methyltransferase RlmN [Spirochaetales bacterium]|jgi:23S rRNA (adenine2503-C2)-methyltransferase|nr:23S rRNA (adenine(2503)-C(2))-methyltransferase RlmN [Spirochaetales bacterium]